MMGDGDADGHRKGKGREGKGGKVPICSQTISVKAPMNCGVAFMFSRRDSSSTILPMENQREALRR